MDWFNPRFLFKSQLLRVYQKLLLLGAGFIDSWFTCLFLGLNCKDIKNRGQFQADGLYWLDPDAGSHSNAFLAYCDMTSYNGGWTMCYTTDEYVKSKTEVTYSAQFPYGSDGYRTCFVKNSACVTFAWRLRVSFNITLFLFSYWLHWLTLKFEQLDGFESVFYSCRVGSMNQDSFPVFKGLHSIFWLWNPVTK